MIDLGEAEIFERIVGQMFEGGGYRKFAGGDAVEKRFEVVGRQENSQKKGATL
jgi:hypothetical protein